MLLFFARRAAVCFCWGLAVGIPAVVSAQTNYYTTNGTEYAIIGSLPGDQVFPDMALNSSGGFVVWQDNITDGSGWGVSARHLDGTLSGDKSTFRVNAQGTNDQNSPRVAMLKNGGAAFVWQGGKLGYQHIFARFLNSSNIFLTTTDVLVSTFTNNFQINPAVTVLNNGNVVVVWGSFNQAGSNSLQDVYGQIFTQSGQKVGTNFLINQFTYYNQHLPAIAALTNGGFVVAWVSEQERVIGVAPTVDTAPSQLVYASVDIYARLYNSSGVATTNEFLVNADNNSCVNPSVAVASDGSFMVAWQVHNAALISAWDVFARSFSSAGVGGSAFVVNSHVGGSQYLPHIKAIGTDYLIIWTSYGQDGSREGVYGQFVHKDGTLVGGEFRVNTTTFGQQMQPALASDGVEQFLVVWTSYAGSPNGFDLFAQRYINVNGACNAMGAPFVWAPFTLNNGVYQPQLQVSWPPLLGISVSNYAVYVNGVMVTNLSAASNMWTMTAANGLTITNTVSFQVAYTTIAGCQPLPSPATSGTTWSGLNWYGIPYEWMAYYYGGYINGTYRTNNWPSSTVPPPGASGSAPTLLQIFLSGGDPGDSSTWLQTTLTKTAQGLFLSWKTQPGLTYQVQMTTNFTSWSVVPNGSARYAATTSDSMNVGGVPAGYYRVLLLRQ